MVVYYHLMLKFYSPVKLRDKLILSKQWQIILLTIETTIIKNIQSKNYFCVATPISNKKRWENEFQLLKNEIDNIIEHLEYPISMVINLLYGCGLRLTEGSNALRSSAMPVIPGSNCIVLKISVSPIVTGIFSTCLMSRAVQF